MILDRITKIKPEKLLDVGCRDGSYTVKLSPYCRHITAVDINAKAIENAKAKHGKPNIEYISMDARKLEFADQSFDLVCEREALHHIDKWQKALDEMLRVSKGHILIEEPLNDPRDESKKNSKIAHRFFLDIQREAGYSHFEFLSVKEITYCLKHLGLEYEVEIMKSDEPETWEEFFEPFEEFASKTKRPDYWRKRLNDFLKEMRGKPLTHSDTLFIEAKR
jgi:ubiquinone/menaquinone biosynthesis C-methylase UbiE